MRSEDGAPSPARDPSAAAGTVLSELRTRVAADELVLISAFAKLFLPNARLLESVFPTSDIAGLTLGACRFLCERHTVPLAFRAYVPSTSEHGWTCPSLVVEVATDDEPGLINAICGVIEEQGGRIEALVSATATVERDPTGLAKSIAAGSGQADECLVHLQLSGVDNPAGLESAIRQHVSALGRTHEDAGPLLAEIQQVSAQLRAGTAEDRETADFLAWLADGRFHLAGFQEIGPDGSATRSVGIYLDPPAGLQSMWDGAAADRDLTLYKTRARDPVHLGEFLDEIRVFPSQPTASDPRAYRIAGSLSSQAFLERTSGIPTARTIWTRVLEELRGPSEEIDADAAAAAFDNLPIDLVLAVPTTEITHVTRMILASDTQPGFRVRVSPSRTESEGISFMTFVAPRQHLGRSDTDRVGQIVRERIAPILAKRFVSDNLSVARIHYALDTASEKVRPELLEDLVAQVRKILSSWRDAPIVDRSSAPAADHVESRAVHTSPRPSTPTPDTGGKEQIEFLADGTSTRRFTLRFITSREPGIFNQIVSAVDDLGLRILEHRAESTSPTVETHDLVVEAGGEDPVDASGLVELLHGVRNDSVESDELNSLCWRAGMNAASIELMRGFGALTEILGKASRTAVHRALTRNFDAAQALLRAFEAKFDPRLPISNDNQRNRDLSTARAVLDSAIDQPGDRVDHNVLREVARIFDHLVRTSFYCGDRTKPGRAIALKLENPDQYEAKYETFVYAAGFEGHMLRGGAAARAKLGMVDDVTALRATNLAELVEQMVRAGHVSTDPGAAHLALKGSGRDSDHIDLALRSFLGALLDVTDNVVNGGLVRNKDVVAFDEADSYFSVLVGDRPTGFADVARKVIHEREFWMGDAAVTRFDARVAADGAWAGLEKTLTRGRDKADSITAIAIGPPHALRLPPGVRLVAAFDDHEIFLDPRSDAKKCAEALTKLGHQEASSWSDFPVDLRERGSTVLSRDGRKVELSEEARELLGWTANTADADEVARAILEHDADLLWVCASSASLRTASELGRSDSGQLEIDVSRARARCIAEIGHELLSPQARVAYARTGGVVHTPAAAAIAADILADRISNVDLSLNLAGPSREVLDTHSAEVAAGIREAALQVPPREIFAIELDQRRSEMNCTAVAGCIRHLAKRGQHMVLNRYAISETDLATRHGTNAGLTRPETAVLRSAVGLDLQLDIRGSSLCEDMYIRPWIDAYFPAPISQHSAQLIDQHPLRYEIAALTISDRVLEVMGFTFVAETAEVHGLPQVEIIKAWCAALIFGGVQEVCAEVEGSGIAAGSADHQDHRLSIARALKRATRRLVELRSSDLSLEKIMDRLASGVGEILRAWPETLPEPMRPAHESAIDLGVRTGLGRVTADHIARIAHLAEIIDICDLAIQINSPRSTVADVFLGLDHLLRFTETEDMLQTIRLQDPQWGERAAAHLQARLSSARRGLTTEVVAAATGRRQPIERYVDAHQGEIHAAQRLIGEVKSSGQATVAAVEVLIGGLENLTRGQRRSW